MSTDKEKALQGVLDGMSDDVRLTHARCECAETKTHPSKEVTVVLSFSERGFGFGEVAMVQTPDGLFMDGEYMSNERIKRYFCSLIDNAVRETDQDPGRHALYNRVMGRRCGTACQVCHPDPQTAS